MNAEQALKICRFAKALSPAQAIDEYQPEAWALILRRIDFTDAMAALEELGGEQEWMHVSHIVRRVKRNRAARIESARLPEPPPGLADDTAGYATWLAETRARVASGEQLDAPPAVASVDHKRHRDEILAGAFHHVDEEER